MSVLLVFPIVLELLGRTYLGQVMPTWKCRAFLGLHQSARGLSVGIVGSADADIATALLHDDAEDDALLDAELGGVDDGVVDAADVFVAVARLQHRGFVDVEEGGEVFPAGFGGEGGGGAGVIVERHFEGAVVENK